MAGDEVLSLAEIEARFDSEWVLLADPETDEALNVKRGKLIWHSKDRDEVYRKAEQLRPEHSAILYVGTVPNDTVVVL
jgi:hypothetical protein